MPTIRHKVLNQEITYSILKPLPNGTRPLDMDNAWERENIVKLEIPQLRGVDDGTSGGCSGVIRFHRFGAYQLQRAFAEIEAAGLKSRILSFAGSYYPRMIRGSTSAPSEHSFGSALDINAAWNGLNRTPAAKGEKGSVVELVPIFEKWGFYWGGRFTRKDGMHWEIHKLIAAAAAPVEEEPAGLLVVWNGNVLTMKELIERGGHTVLKITEQLQAGRVYVNSEPKAGGKIK